MEVDAKSLFAVFVPSSETDESTGRVFDTVVAATAFAKENKTRGARFKQFSDAVSAKKFAEGLIPETPRRTTAKDAPFSANEGALSPSSVSEGPPSPFPSLSRQEMSAFKRAIESNDSAKFEELIQDNPRYLVNYNGDTPTIVFEGSRYNALHIAARTKNEHATRRTLELISDADHRLLHRLYPDDPFRTNENRRLHLLDCYLNTPDKSLNETPLHFAAKLGCVAIVELLVAYKACQKDIKNKYGQTPGEMACDKMNDTSENCSAAKRRILSLLATVYVPLYRPIDFSGSAVLLPPMSEYPSEVLSGDPAAIKAMMNGLGDNGSVASSPALRSEMRLAAVAGPCSAEQAADFHQAWMSSKRELKRADLHKGYELTGRALAAEMHVEWTEWWPFLNAYANLIIPSGLSLLESHLTDAAAIAVSNDDDDGDGDSLTAVRSSAKKQETSMVSLGSSTSLSSLTSLSAGRRPIDPRLQTSPWFGGGGPRSLFTNSRLRLDSSRVKKRLQFADDDDRPPAQSPGRLIMTSPAGIDIVVDGKADDDDMEFQDSLAYPYSPLDDDMADLCERFERQGSLNDNKEEEEEEEKFVTPPSTPPAIFMADICPTKVDYDVYSAISLALQRDSAILNDFPRTRRWFHAVQTYSPQQRSAWPSLDSPRAKLVNPAASTTT